MTSRVRSGSAVKEGSKVVYSKDHHFHGDTEERVPKSYKNGSRENRYLFGMSRHEETSKNGRECKEETEEDPDLLYKRSKQHFGAWDLKDIVHGENGRSRKPNDRFDDPRSLTNGKSKTDITRLENTRQDRREEGHSGSLTWEEDRARTGSVDREQSGGHRSPKKKEGWSNSEAKSSSRSTRSRNNGNKEDAHRTDERDLLLREIENLTVDGRSPDRRIMAMIERFKSRDEDKSKSRREHSSFSPERIEEYRSRSGGRNDLRADHASDDRINDRPDRSGRVQRDEEERRSPRSRMRESERFQREEPIRDGPSRSIDRRSRSTEKYSDTVLPDKEEKSKRCESFRQKNEAHNADRNYRRKSREMDDDQSRARDSSKRRSYAYDINPDDFDVRIQRYERAIPEPRKDSELSRRVPPKDSEPGLARKESLKDHDRQVTRKSSFKVSDSKKSSGRDRETSLNRKISFKDQENDVYRKNSFKGQTDGNKRYFGKDPENDISRKSSSREHEPGVGRKNSFKEQNADYGRISFKNPENETERKNSFKGHAGGVSRISFKDHEDELPRINCYKDPEVEIRRVVPFKEPGNDLGRRNSLKEKTVEFAGISFKDDEDDRDRKDAEKRNSHPDRDSEIVKASFRCYDEPERKRSPNGRYVEFGKVSFKAQDEVSRGSPSREQQDHEIERKSSLKERDSSKRRVSLRSKAREAFDKRSDRHSRPLTPPKKRNETPIEPPRDERKDREEFCARSWHESNKVFAAKYLRDNGKHRVNPEGRSEIERDLSPETMIAVQEFHDTKYMNEGFGNDDVADVKRDQQRRKPDSTIIGNQNSGAPAASPDSRYASSTRERNGATIIRIRSSPENPVERRRRRRPAQEAHAGRRRRYEGDEAAEEEEEDDEGEEVEVDEDSDDDDDNENDRRLRSRRDAFVPGRGVPTPSRRVWNYREGGVLITDVEDGQPCLQCGETCPGFLPHIWRKNCTSCKCPREAHDVCHEEWVSVRSRLGLKGEESSPPIGFDPREKGLAWAPPGLPAHKVEEYFSMLPEISVPRLGTTGERHRDRQLAIQLPKQDLARAYCRHLNPKHASSADDFMAARNEIALDIGSVQEALERDLNCGACNTPLKYGSLAISAGKLGLLYHPSCFRCADCKELLVDLAYCVHDDVLFCERHYAEQLKPRCPACDELIFSGEYTKAMNKDWHSGHFCCWQCDESLTGQRYVLRDEHPYCIKCYESVFANGCEECSKIIGIDSKDLSYKDKHWHEACFLCNRCRVSLVDKQFGSKVDKIYCGNCYDAQFASRCDGCGEIFRAGTKKMEYKTRQWHEKCFCCVVCKNPIGTKSFIPREQEIYCSGCYEDKFATRCVKCNKIITSGGVTYKNEPWHRDCFTCSNCNNSLAGQRFTSRDDKPYCADCFGELFAKRCTACSKPITGIGGTRFISFEDRHWHNDCFICAGCKTSLVGRGFITDGEDIICPECAKMKLM